MAGTRALLCAVQHVDQRFRRCQLGCVEHARTGGSSLPELPGRNGGRVEHGRPWRHQVRDLAMQGGVLENFGAVQVSDLAKEGSDSVWRVQSSGTLTFGKWELGAGVRACEEA
jgi:hypothetical protein